MEGKMESGLYSADEWKEVEFELDFQKLSLASPAAKTHQAAKKVSGRRVRIHHDPRASHIKRQKIFDWSERRKENIWTKYSATKNSATEPATEKSGDSTPENSATKDSTVPPTFLSATNNPANRKKKKKRAAKKRRGYVPSLREILDDFNLPYVEEAIQYQPIVEERRTFLKVLQDCFKRSTDSQSEEFPPDIFEEVLEAYKVILDSAYQRAHNT